MFFSYCPRLSVFLDLSVKILNPNISGTS